MDSNVKFPVYGSYIFELLFKNKLFSYISRTNYYILQRIESYRIYYEQVFIRLRQSNLHIHIWLTFDELYTKIGHVCDISFQFVVPFLAFVFVVSGTNNFFGTLETTSTFCSLIFNLWVVVYFLDIQNTSHLVKDLIQRPVWFSNHPWMLGRTRAFPNSYVNSKLVTLMLLSPRIVLAFVLHVSNINASAFEDHLFELILVEWFVDKRSATSTPPLRWSYITCTCGFFR